MKNRLTDKFTGLEIGADDYLTKPFYLPELNAQIRSVLRRRLFGGHEQLKAGELTFWLNQQRVHVRNTDAKLTNKKYELLLFLVIKTDQLLFKSAIAEYVWGYAMDAADSHEFLYTHIKNLRRNLITAGCPDYIQTRYGAGCIVPIQTP